MRSSSPFIPATVLHLELEGQREPGLDTLAVLDRWRELRGARGTNGCIVEPESVVAAKEANIADVTRLGHEHGQQNRPLDALPLRHRRVLRLDRTNDVRKRVEITDRNDITLAHCRSGSRRGRWLRLRNGRRGRSRGRGSRRSGLDTSRSVTACGVELRG